MENEFETLIGLLSHYSPIGQESAAVHWLVERMRALQFTHAFIDEAGNAVGVVGNGPKSVLLLGHIDTVPGEIPIRIEGDKLYGRGSVDAKGPLAVFVGAVAQVGPVDGWQFVVVGAVDEEGDSTGARTIVNRYRPDFAIIGEPSRWDRVTLGYKGSAWAEITVRRSMAHTAGEEESACEAAVNLWQTLRVWTDVFNAHRARVFDQILPILQSLASGDNGFEGWARLKVGVRLPVDFSPEAWYAQLEQLAEGDDVKRLGFATPAYQGEKNTPVVRAFLGAIRAQGGQPSFVLKSGTADLNVVAPAWGCPAVAYGPGDSSLDHTPFEYISLSEYIKAIIVLQEVLLHISRHES